MLYLKPLHDNFMGLRETVPEEETDADVEARLLSSAEKAAPSLLLTDFAQEWSCFTKRVAIQAEQFALDL